MQYNSAGWMEQYNKKEAYWLHDGNAKRPHALLTSKNMHSGGFFNSELVAEDPFLLDFACADLVELLQQNDVRLSKIDRVVGPAMGAISIAHDVARHVAKINGRRCLRSYCEKEGEGSNKRMVFKRTTIRPGERVLLVEDVLTTGDSVGLAAAAVHLAGGNTLSFVAVLVNRSGLQEVDGKKIVSLIDRPMPTWTPSKCPLCKQGSEAIHPKGNENWARLNAVY